MTYGVLVFPSLSSKKFISLLLKQINSLLDWQKISYDRVLFEKNFFVLEVENKKHITKISDSMKKIVGIENYYLIEIIHDTNFKILANYMVSIGKKVIFEDQTFWINISISETTGKFAEGDLKFYVTGKLIEILSSKNIKSAKNIRDANKIIYCFICKNKSYISYESYEGISGFPKNYQKEKIVSGIYDENSIVSTFQLIKLGFTPYLFFLFFSKQDLLHMLKILDNVLIFFGGSKISIDFYHVDKVVNKEHLKPIILKLLYEKILFNLYPNFKLSLPYSYVWNSSSYIGEILNKYDNKNIIMPIINHTRKELDKISDEVNMNSKIKHQQFHENLDFLNTPKSFLFVCPETIDKIFYKVKKEKKSISINITSNYIHDIMDSI